MPTNSTLLAFADGRTKKITCRLQLVERLAEVNDVNAVAGIEDERLHLGIPPFGLVSEMDASIQQFLYANTNHKFPFVRSRGSKHGAERPSRGTRD